ncbi:hypothetical protein MP228_007142 [Amoeboaphelidium protococcarum]|nr:hypothetical protein MP228_007142 [Amoeboaphelidium protococcarum]
MSQLPAGSKRTLLIAVDHSDHSKYVFKWAIDNLVRSGDYIMVVTCQEQHGKSSGGSKSVYTEVDFSSKPVDADEEAERSRHVALLDAVRAELRAKTDQPSKALVIRCESPKTALVQLCTDKRVDLMIMGSRGLGAVKKALIGSVSDYCVQNAPCPVLIVRKPKN